MEKQTALGHFDFYSDFKHLFHFRKMDNFGAPDTILFALVIVSTAGAGVFQGWFEAYTQDEPQRHGLALPKGKGPFGDFLYLLVLTCSVPLILGT